MIKTLPFTALRTLESVVRLHGFVRAAEELNVTQSAVSQHIKSLEEWTGHKLLYRGAGKTRATKEGLRLAGAVTEGFGMVQTVCEQLRDRKNPANKALRVAAPPGFAFVWILPRLMYFDQEFPDIPVSLSTDAFGHEDNPEEADIMVYYGKGRFPGFHAEWLMGESMSPVCKPEMAQRLRKIGDLTKCTILEDDFQDLRDPPSWDYWARKAGITLPDFVRSRKFSQTNLVVQAAIEGLGVAMGRTPLVNDAIREGSLVQPFPQVVESHLSYWFVCRPAAMNTKTVQIFRNWLFKEAGALPAFV